MQSIGEILSESSRLLRRNPGLFLPLGVGAVAGLALGDHLSAIPVTVSLWLLNLALTAGLLSMIRSAHLSEMGGWDAFLVGVGRYFAPILAGSLVQISLVFLTLLPVVAWLKATVGIPQLPDYKAAMAGNIPLAQAEAIVQWAAAICAWAGVWVIILFFLALWKQAIVAQSISWPKAWQLSAGYMKAHWLPLSALLTLYGLGLGAGMLLLAVPVPVVKQLGAVAMLVVSCYFSVVLMLALMGPAPATPKGENVDATA